MSAIKAPYKKITTDEITKALLDMAVPVKDPTRTFTLFTSEAGASMFNEAMKREARLMCIKLSLNTLRCKRAITTEEHKQFETMLISDDPDTFDLAEALIEAKLKPLYDGNSIYPTRP